MMVNSGMNLLKLAIVFFSWVSVFSRLEEFYRKYSIDIEIIQRDTEADPSGQV